VRFLAIEAAGGILLLVATVAALVWANSPWSDDYAALWSSTVRIDVGSYSFEEDLRHVVNDLLMAVFFFVVGMEIKRELVVGELRDRRRVALPAMAALGGMVVPALVYVAFNAGEPSIDGWGVPMATDIAFALGVVALLGSRVPEQVKVMLLTLAIVDDVGAITVIAVFYTDDTAVGPLLAAAVLVVLAAAMHRAHVVYPPLFVILAAALWLAIYESGVHATIAGVVMGLLMPATPRQSVLETDEIVDVLENRANLGADEVRATADLIKASVSPCDRLIDALHPWTSFVIVPLFALANAGIELSAERFTDPSRVFLGVAVALVLGKLLGVASFSWLAVRSGLGRLPDGVGWSHVIGVSAVAGIGFTVSLFIADLAFEDPLVLADAKAGILTGSLVAALAGAALLRRASR
jgi:NhaA family Na+:H+ antiporter